MNWKYQRRSAFRAPSHLLWLTVLALCFLGGLLLGQALLSCVPGETGEELRQYLRDFMVLEDRGRWPSASVLRGVLLYFRYPLLAFLCGLTSMGVLLLPLTAAGFACSLSFCVCCFAASFDSGGVLLALALLGLRCAVTLPCFFLLALPAMERAWGLASGRRESRGRCGDHRMDWLRLMGVSGCLLAGWYADRLLSPRLIEMVLAKMML